MTRHHAIIGFRQDRIGARLICLLNVMRIARKFGVAGRYLWLSQPDGPYPELVDPRDFLDPAFVAAHIDIVARAPERSELRNLPAAAPGMNGAGFARTLAEGRRYECDSMSEIIRFMDESEAEAAAGLRAAAEELVLSPRLARALAGARRILARAGGWPSMSGAATSWTAIPGPIPPGRRNMCPTSSFAPSSPRWMGR